MTSSFEIPGVLTRSQKALVRRWWKKVTAAYPKAQNFKEMKVPSIDKGVFGIPLAQSLDYAHSSISYIDDHTGSQCYGVVPTIVAKCGSFLKEEGIMTEGIFRLPGNARRLRILQTIFDTPETYGSQLEWSGYTVHDAACILRRFINHLPEPVITLAYYRPFKETIDQTFPSVNKKVDAFQVLIEKLPLSHQYLLLYILDMLAMFVTTTKYTRMDVDCLAAIFVPGILSHPDDKLNPSSYKHSQKVLHFLIDHQDMLRMPCSEAGLGTCLLPPSPPPSTLKSSTLAHRLLQRSATTVAAKSTKRGCHSSNGQPSLSSYDHADDDHRASAIFSLAKGSLSGTGLDSIVPGEDDDFDEDTPTRMMTPTPITTAGAAGATIITPPAQLRRSRTLPGYRINYGRPERRQVVYVNRNASHCG